MAPPCYSEAGKARLKRVMGITLFRNSRNPHAQASGYFRVKVPLLAARPRRKDCGSSTRTSSSSPKRPRGKVVITRTMTPMREEQGLAAEMVPNPASPRSARSRSSGDRRPRCGAGGYAQPGGISEADHSGIVGIPIPRSPPDLTSSAAAGSDSGIAARRERSMPSATDRYLPASPTAIHAMVRGRFPARADLLLPWRHAGLGCPRPHRRGDFGARGCARAVLRVWLDETRRPARSSSPRRSSITGISARS